MVTNERKRASGKAYGLTGGKQGGKTVEDAGSKVIMYNLRSR